MTRFKQLQLLCNCGHPILKYKKGGTGRWLKVHPSRVIEYQDERFETLIKSPPGTDISCTQCEQRVATIQNLGGKFIAKLNQGQIMIQ